MLHKKTVLVLGAGSSAEFGLPTGNGLAETLSEKLCFRFPDYGGGRLESGDPHIYEALREHEPSQIAEYHAAGNEISNGIRFSVSVDDYLYKRGSSPHIVFAGKVGIVSSILEAERQSALFLDSFIDNADLMKAHGTWIQRLFRILQSSVPFVELPAVFQNLTIINFNYDRCVEHYFFHAVRAAYNASNDEAAWAMPSLRIWHPYGKVGRLPWEEGPGLKINFGARNHPRVPLVELAKRIRTFTESTHDSQNHSEWRDSIAEADQVVFLGFGFHRQNMELLRARAPRPTTIPVYATTYGASLADTAVFAERINTYLMGGQNVKSTFVPATSADMIAGYGLRLSD